jgi:hypothetical protein
MTLNTNSTYHNTQIAVRLWAECNSTECRYAECRGTTHTAITVRVNTTLECGHRQN